MQTQRTRLFSCIAAGLMGTGAVLATAPVTAASLDPSLSASAGISNMYLFRGSNLSDGSAHVSGSLDVDSGMGLYTGVWAASGDDSLGQEYDLYAGYSTDVTDDISIDIGAINYIYPKQSRTAEQIVNDGGNAEFETQRVSQDGFADFSEAYASISAYGATLSYWDNVAGAPGYTYTSLSYGYGPVSATIGQNSTDDTDNTHLDLTFQFNDELSFTASTWVDVENDAETRRSTLIQVAYSKSFDF
ncbi:TorF family putative porin [Salicola sp. Rm-C-2C1-2]|uniref:TorF family putative porin n=1 Tax=Salicola sp. Rm-C-2C1-2 TaxID=3141321 RepID=UPI0032E43FA8